MAVTDFSETRRSAGGHVTVDVRTDRTQRRGARTRLSGIVVLLVAAGLAGLLWPTATSMSLAQVPGAPVPAVAASAASSSAGQRAMAGADGSVAISVELTKPQYVTVVIEDSAGKRVRNLISETKLPAGKNRILWDGYDDGETKDGVLTRHLVDPGTYRVRGLTHDGIKTLYEFPLYSGGNPPWATKDETGAWLADHSSPLGATFIPEGSPYGGGKPQVLLTALVAETGRTTVWVGTDGTTYQRRAMWGWDGGQSAATDLGKNRDSRYYAYVLLSFGEKSPVVLRALATKGDSGPTIAQYKPKVQMEKEPREIGLALTVRDGLAVATVPLDDALVFFDVKNGKVLGTAAVKAPKGVLIDAQGRLLVSTNGTVKRFTMTRSNPDAAPVLDAGQVIISGLQDPRTIQTDPQGKELYVADWGTSHQVKVFTPDGKPTRVIGKAGGFQIGAYDELRMHQPQGLAIDNLGQLWVAEADWLPKRVSLWDASTGKFKRASYGPPHYGGGGTIDPTDKTRCFYGEYGGTLEFKLDWEKGTSTLVAVPVRTWNVPQKFDPMPGHSYGAFGPEVPFHANGRLYLGLGYQSSLRSNETQALWLYDDVTHTARPVCHVGSMRHWEFVRTAPWLKELQDEGGIYEPFLCWTDLNADGRATRDEFTVRRFRERFTRPDGSRSPLFGFRIMTPRADLSLSGSWALYVPPPTFRADGTPIYDLKKATFMIPPSDSQHWNEDGYDGLLLSDGTWLQGFSGWRNGKKVWQYPAFYEIGVPPQYPGHVVEPTRLMGPPFSPAKSDARNVICVNGERGNMYLLTGDGLFIQTIGGHRAVDPLMHFPKAVRGMDVSGYSFEDEHFHPTVTCTKDGDVYMVAGKEHSSIFRLDGFASVKTRDFGTAEISEESQANLPGAQVFAARKQGRMTMNVARTAEAPVVDGKLEGDWSKANWVDIGTAGKGAVTVSGERLYVAWKTNNPNVLTNGASDPEFAFKRGSCVDLMLGSANRDGADPVAGDLRLLLCQVRGKPLAVLYRQVAPPALRLGRPVLFESPIGKVQFDDVAIVTKQVQLAQADGNVEMSVPLKLLGISGNIGDALRGDLGILRGDGVQTVQRTYWNNLDSAMVSDIPTEARLAPSRWGELKIVKPGDGVVPAAQ